MFVVCCGMSCSLVKHYQQALFLLQPDIPVILYSFCCSFEEEKMNQSEKAWLCIRCLLKYKCFAFCVCLIFLPGLHCGKLLCYYCPMQLINKPCKQVLTECLPGQLCFIANGHYGAYSGVFIKGCILEDKCLKKGNHIIYGNNISLSYHCCIYDYCNSGQHWTFNHQLLEIVVFALVIF